MREYIITIAVAAICASVADILAPKEWSKYIRVIIGFLILSVIVAPVVKFKDSRILSPTTTYNISDEPLTDRVAQELKKNVEKDIVERLKSEFGVDAEALVEIEIDENYKIKGIKAIEVKTWKNPDGMIDRLTNIYGCEKIELRFE